MRTFIPTSPHIFMQQWFVTSAVFPHKSVAEGIKFIQTPELWGSGPLLMLGVPRFEIHEARGLTTFQDRKCVSFKAFDKQVHLVSNIQGDSVKVCIEDFGRIQAHIYPYKSQNTGFVLNLIVSQTPLSLFIQETPNLKHLTSQHTKQCLEKFMWQGMNATFTPDPILQRFRDIIE